MFNLHPQLDKDTILVGQFALSDVLLMNDARYPWLILVPRRDDLREVYQLDDADQQQLLRESSFVAETMANLFKADKMNIAAIGNMVPQLHIHHIARFKDDACWPKPVWGVGQARPYSEDELGIVLDALKSALADYLI